MPPRDSLQGTLLVALILCIACSSVVSIAAVSLKGIQEANKALDKKKNILLAAGLADGSTNAADVNSIYDESIVKQLIDLETGEPVAEDAGVDAETYDAKKAAADPDMKQPVEPAGALPGLPYREPYAEVYEIKKDGQTDGYILPIYGKGLWSTLYGFLALESDKQTVRGITYYSHAETPGLGGEVDNPLWKESWTGKKVYDSEGDVELEVLKGKAGDNEYAVDGLSGATITTKGVDNMIKYWLGPTAFGKYLANN